MYQVSKTCHQLCLKTKLKLKTHLKDTDKNWHDKMDKNVSLVTTERLYVVSEKKQNNEELYASYYKPDFSA